MSRYRVVFERPEIEIEAESAEAAVGVAYDAARGFQLYVEFVEESGNA